MRKIISLIMALAMVFSLSIPAFAADTKTLYVDISEVVDSSKTVDTVYLSAFGTGNVTLVNSAAMTKVSDTVYSYDVADYSSASVICVSLFYTDDSYADYNFDVDPTSDDDFYTPTANRDGTWSTYSGPTVNGNTTGDVTASYTPSTTEDTTAKITGLYITVDGVKYENSTAEAPITIYSDSVVTVTVYGENFDSLPAFDDWLSAFTYFGSNVEQLYEDNTYWTVNENENTATYTADNEILQNATTASELKYTNDRWSTDIGSGIWVIYDEGTKPVETAKITGLYITVDGVKYESSTAEAPITIYSDSVVTVTVYGENFANLPEYGAHTSAFCYFGSNSQYLWKDASMWSIDTDNNTATLNEMSYDVLAGATVASELKYTNDSGANIVGSGIYVIYNEGTKPQLTYNVTIDENIAHGTITADPTTAAAGATVTLTVTPATGYQIGTVTVKDANGNTVDFTETGAASGVYTFTMPASNVTVTATFTEIVTTSAEITWGSMSFTYSDEQVEQPDGSTADKGWYNDAADGGTVTVKNAGNTTFTAMAEYKQETGYTEINGYFAENSATASSEIAADASHTFTLTLSGKPEKAITAGTKIGSVTVTIEAAN